jgi:hypothetical protein
MNAVEIEEAVSKLAGQPFNREEFPYSFLEAYGNKQTTINRLREGNSNKSKIKGGVLQRNNIHIATCAEGKVFGTLQQLHNSPETAQAKAKLILVTDGIEFQAEDLNSGETVACSYKDFHEHFSFFFELAGISSVKEIRESTFDIKATGRLNKLYIELLRSNPEWAAAGRRQEMNHFFARLIFCFFAEDTNIFNGDNLFTGTVQRMSASDGSNIHEIMGELFRAMDTKVNEREVKGIRNWANTFPYVNGELFSGSTECPKFTKMARSYLLHVGNLDWKQINPDIFGSMIQAVADEDERDSLGMHYTSVPNILKVLNPLFLDDLRNQLEEAGDNARKLLNLRKRIARIRVFDPACGSGNFLVIAYKQLREIENAINIRRGEPNRPSEIPLTNFRGIEIRSFSAEIARLALIIAEFQCDVLYLGQQLALAEFLPLDAENWITAGNALSINWLTVCPPTGTGVKLHGDDLFSTPLDQAEIDFENEGGEIFICGNPPYKGRNRQSKKEKQDTLQIFSKYKGSFASLDYVANWMIKSAEYCAVTKASAALVTTNSICQGEQVSLLWPLVFDKGFVIHFAHTSFKWSNLASNKAGVTVVIIGISLHRKKDYLLFSDDVSRNVDLIGPYLVPGSSVIVGKKNKPISELGTMYLGNMAKDGGNLIMKKEEADTLIIKYKVPAKFLRYFYGSDELINAKPRACLWIEDEFIDEAMLNHKIKEITSRVKDFRSSSKATSTRKHVATPHKFVQLSASVGNKAIVIPRVSSENRHYLPMDYIASKPVIGDKCYVMYDEPLWNSALIASRMHIVWIGTVCSRLRTDYSYGNKLGWNTFPVPKLTTKNKEDLTRCAEEILIARERHFPATIADLYAPGKMPDDLKRAHERNDEVLERIYIGRRFKNDTERLEKLFEMYTEMTSKEKVR